MGGQAVEFFAEWSLSPSNVAFLRVQSGAYDPAVVGDKHKWYSYQLDSITFRVWNTANTELTQIYSEFINRDDDSDNESDEESDLSTSSTHSSLNEFVEEMCHTSQTYSQYLGTMPLNKFINLCPLFSRFAKRFILRVYLV